MFDIIFLGEFITTLLVIFLIVKIVFPREKIIRFIIKAFRRIFFNSVFKTFFLLMVITLVISIVENTFDSKLDFFNGNDFSKYFFKYEGLVAVFLQKYENVFLTSVMIFFYMIMFTAMLFSAPFIYSYSGNVVAFRKLSIFYLLNYVFAMPFYLFFPVNEVWVKYGAFVNPLILYRFPQATALFKYTNGLNNCFPSLHVSLSLSLAIVSLSSENKVLKIISFGNAFVIMFSTLYLGIHWLTDVIGGIILVLTIELFYGLFLERELREDNKTSIYIKLLKRIKSSNQLQSIQNSLVNRK